MSDQTEVNHLLEHLFRHESGKLVAILTRLFGAENLEMAEDVVQDALVEAINHWNYNGIPENPSAWLYRVAKNKALNILNREKLKSQYAGDISNQHEQDDLSHLFSETEIQDDLVRMIFTCCHPAISPDSQIALALKTLCGFSIPEIARAFFTSKENINKRLVRARDKIRKHKPPFEVPEGNELASRLETVLETIYLLYNEGYSASSGEDIIRYEVCEEAIRLAEILVTHPSVIEKSNLYALLALMQLNASRFKSRVGQNGNILTLKDQNRSTWDLGIMKKGFENLDLSISETVSKYHILASISAYHCSSPNFESTNWPGILSLYDKLAEVDPSPIILLNRAIALSKAEGISQGIQALRQIENSPELKSYYLLHSAKADLFIENNQLKDAADSLKIAIALAPLPSEKMLLKQKMNQIEKKT